MSEAVLLEESGSASVAVTVALFVIWPETVGVTVIVTIADEPLANVPMAQLTALAPLQDPCVVTVDPNVTALGRLSVTLTFVADAGPLFVTIKR